MVEIQLIISSLNLCEHGKRSLINTVMKSVLLRSKNSSSELLEVVLIKNHIATISTRFVTFCNTLSLVGPAKIVKNSY